MAPEKTVEEYLRKRVKEAGGKAYKLESPGNAGMPDRLVCIPGLETLFVETKAPGKKLRPNQEVRIRELLRLGRVVWVVDTKGLVDSFMSMVGLALRGGVPLVSGGGLPE